MDLSRRSFLKSLSAVGAACAAGGTLLSSCAAQKRPNIIFLLTDDQRWDMLGCAGNSILQTPNLDALARDGVRFENAYVTTAICMTSRASFFTGQYARRHGINDFFSDLSSVQLNESYPLQLRQAGYRTGFIGKWGVGFDTPNDQFDFWRGVPEKGVVGQPHYRMQDENGEDIHLTRLISNQSVEFLNSCSNEQPFCLSVSFKAPHVQDEDPEQFIYDEHYADLYRDVTIPVPETAAHSYYRRLPVFLRDDNTIARKRWKLRFSDPETYQTMVKGHYRLITGVDDAVGRIRKTLKQLNFDQNTVIVFMGDNGFFLGEHGLAGKWYGYEESIRVPLILYDPRRRKGGSVKTEMALNIDIHPTLLDIAGVDIPERVQGKSLLPLLHDRDVEWRSDFLYEHYFSTAKDPKDSLIPRSEGVVTLKSKYLRYIDRNPVYEQLFDLETDPGETRNLAKDPEYQDKLKAMRARCDELCSAVQ